MPDRKTNCTTITEFSYTGAVYCLFLGVLCEGGQPLDNCLLWDKLDHDQAISKQKDWSESDKPIAI